MVRGLTNRPVRAHLSLQVSSSVFVEDLQTLNLLRFSLATRHGWKALRAWEMTLENHWEIEEGCLFEMSVLKIANNVQVVNCPVSSCGKNVTPSKAPVGGAAFQPCLRAEKRHSTCTCSFYCRPVPERRRVQHYCSRYEWYMKRKFPLYRNAGWSLWELNPDVCSN